MSHDEIDKRFWSQVDKRGPEDCWEWLGYRNKQGYGCISARRIGLNTRRAHRLSFFLKYRYLPEMVMHTCDNPPCVNPAHLRGGTALDNIRDMWTKGRQNQLCGESHGNATLTEAKVKEARERRDDGEKIKDIARSMNVGYDAISFAVRRLSWRHVP